MSSSASPVALEGARYLTMGRLVPWFIVGFLGLAMARSVGLFPPLLAESCRKVSRWGTIAAMAALGLEVQLQAVRRVGVTVAATVLLSLLVLILLSIVLIWSFRIH